MREPGEWADSYERGDQAGEGGADCPPKDGADRTDSEVVPKKNFEHGMRTLGEPLKNVHTFQARVVKLAMEGGTRAARCRLVHPDGTAGLSSRKRASNKYATELTRTGWELMPITRCAYMGLPLSIRKPMLTQWMIAFPAVMGGVDNFVKKKEGPARLFRAKRITIKRAAEAARRKGQPREVGQTPGSLTVCTDKRGKRPRSALVEHPGRLGPKH